MLGAVLGLGVLYFTYLCNGLTYVSHPQKVRHLGGGGARQEGGEVETAVDWRGGPVLKAPGGEIH